MANITFKFRNNIPITLCENKNIYNAGDSEYDNQLKASKQSWHLITAFHRNRSITKFDILEAIFDIVEDKEFFPVGYKEGPRSDCFLVRQCWDAIDCLFKKQLYLNVQKHKERIKLEISLNIAPYTFQQISPINKLHEAIGYEFKALKIQNGVTNVLNLENLNNHPHLEDVFIYLGNDAVFKHLCNYIKEPALNILSSINGINLSNNKIRSLSNFKILEGSRLQMLNLKANNIETNEQLYFLKYLKFKELYLSGNPICKNKDIQNLLKKTFPLLIKCDILDVQDKDNEKNTIGTNKNLILVSGKGILVKSLSSMQEFEHSNDWHQIIVKHQGRFNKNEIAKQFFMFYSTQPDLEEFFLCYYKTGQNEDSFVVRNCFEHLMRLMKNDLRLVMLETQDILDIKINMNYTRFEIGHVEPNELILEVAIKQCYNPIERCLNLENFNEKSGMEQVYINIGSPKVYSKLLQHCCRKYSGQIMEVRLGNNQISNCKGLKALNIMNNLKVLSLINNNIKNVNDLEPIAKTNIKDLRLDGNPLCKNYDLSYKYINDVRELFPYLNILDGVSIENTDQTLNYNKNFICTLKAYDVTEQFISNYFLAYDSSKRTNLCDMYHQNAIFSICFSCKPKHLLNEERYDSYKHVNRNLLTTKNLYRNVFIGEKNITSIFKKLPKTEHDFYSFTTDTTIFNENMIVITVNGVFKDISENSALEPDIRFGFCRTFVLTPIDMKMGIFKASIEYEITNDQLTIVSPTDSQTKNSFKFTSPEIELTCTARDNNDKIAYLAMFQNLTKLKKIWATRCFDEGNWNFEEALKYFVKEMDKGSIPKQAFQENI